MFPTANSISAMPTICCALADWGTWLAGRNTVTYTNHPDFYTSIRIPTIQSNDPIADSVARIQGGMPRFPHGAHPSHQVQTCTWTVVATFPQVS